MWAHRLEAEEYLYPKAEKARLWEGKKVRAVKKKKAFKPKLADQLSKGNQQKIQFMIALISDPELIILDEPLSGQSGQYRPVQRNHKRADRSGKISDNVQPSDGYSGRILYRYNHIGPFQACSAG